MKKVKVYLDNCCFNRPFDNQDKTRIKLETEAKLSIQNLIKAGKLKLVWSYMLDYENEFNPYRERKEIIRTWKGMADDDVEGNTELVQLAGSFIKLGLKPKDSLHWGCAVVSGFNYFITTDDAILRKKNKFKNIMIINPIEFFLLEEK